MTPKPTAQHSSSHTPGPCLDCEWCRFTLRLLGTAYASLCMRRKGASQ